MIGLVFDLRGADFDAMRLADVRDVAERVGRESIATVIVMEAGVEPNAVAAAKIAPGSRKLQNLTPTEIIEELAPLWSLQQDQMFYITGDAAKIEDAIKTDATLVRVGDDDDLNADVTIARVPALFDIVASEYTAGLLEMRYILMRLAQNANPYIPPADAVKL